MEGDSVTLHHNLYVSNIQRDDEIEWRFEGTLIARVIVNNSEYYDEKTFKHRLKLGQTGSLTITNTRSADSGLYQLKTIIGNTESIKKINVIVNAVAAAQLSAPLFLSESVIVLISAAAGSLVYMVLIWMFCVCRGHKKAAQTHEYEIPQSLHKQIGQMTESEMTEVVYTCFTTEQ
ncbi:hypothetical protein cypCar_00040491 [Cyprinus carpio]|nr:hypothetical protein cypCar_00040491 [Cyprinus carpio]